MDGKGCLICLIQFDKEIIANTISFNQKMVTEKTSA